MASSTTSCYNSEMRTAIKWVVLLWLFCLAACDSCSDETGESFTEDMRPRVEPRGDMDLAVDDDMDPPVPVEACDSNTCVCRIGPRGGACTTPYCSLTVEQGVLGRERLFSLTEGRVVDEPGEELLGRRVCEWETDALSNELAREYEIAIRFDADDVPNGFEVGEVVGVDVGQPTLALDAVTDPVRRRVALGVTAPTPLGATVLPASPRTGDELGLPDFNPVDAAAYLRNVSQTRFSAVWHDGQRMYAANGPRVFIWNNGIPTSPASPPDVVLGRPDLASRTSETSASAFVGPPRAIWSDGNRLAVGEANRVLVWQQIPTANFTPADLVLGQDNFSQNKRNKDGAPDASTLSEVQAIWSDGNRLAVADQNNHRILVWNAFPQVSGQPADMVIGQPSFTSNEILAGDLPMYQAQGVMFDGNVFAMTSVFACNCVQLLSGFPQQSNPAPAVTLGGPSGNRVSLGDFNRPGEVSSYGVGGLAVHNAAHVSVFRNVPTVDTSTADFSIGKPDGAHAAILGRISASSFSTVSTLGSLYADDSRLLVADGYRVLAWRTLPDTGFVEADIAIGQPTSATSDANIDYAGIAQDSLAYPAAVSAAGDVTAVADRANNRVVLVRGALDSPDSVTVLGQPSPSQFLPSDTLARSMDTPAGVFTDGIRLIVADSGNHRVLIWDALPTANGASADRVLGQQDFVSGRQNGGQADVDLDGDIDASAASMHWPSGVWANASEIFVADTYNHRVLVFDANAANGADATRVIGQPDPLANAPNYGDGWFSPRAEGLARPTSVTELDDGRLAVADSENNRVVIFDATDVPDLVLGQPDFTSNVSPNWLTGFNTGWPYADSLKSAAAETLRTPYGLAARAGELVVADSGNHRVVRYSAPFATGMAATTVLGQTAPDQRVVNATGLGPRGLDNPEGVAFRGAELLVADTSNHRLLGFADSDVEATSLFGQPTFSRNGINRSSPAFDTLDRPGGFAIAEGAVWVADRGHHRVVAFEADKLSRVLGQLDRGGSLRHAGFSDARAWTMSQPSDLWTNGSRMVVADRDNHRVLIWNEIPEDPTTAPDVILGQPDGTSGAPNRGGVIEASPQSMLGPEGVLVDGDTLFVADSGNNRVLVFDGFPTRTGVAADRVLCQQDFSSNAANAGASPTAATCASPTDMLVVGDALFVADSLNHRVLRFPADSPTGASANQVIGQPSFTTRQPLGPERQPTARIFNNPTRLGFDGSGLFVVDRGNHRVLIYDFLPVDDFQPADRVLGQVGFDTAVVTPRLDGLEAPDGIFVVPDTYNRTTVWIADSEKDRLIEFQRVARHF